MDDSTSRREDAQAAREALGLRLQVRPRTWTRTSWPPSCRARGGGSRSGARAGDKGPAQHHAAIVEVLARRGGHSGVAPPPRPGAARHRRSRHVRRSSRLDGLSARMELLGGRAARWFSSRFAGADDARARGGEHDDKILGAPMRAREDVRRGRLVPPLRSPVRPERRRRPRSARSSRSAAAATATSVVTGTMRRKYAAAATRLRATAARASLRRRLEAPRREAAPSSNGDARATRARSRVEPARARRSPRAASGALGGRRRGSVTKHGESRPTSAVRRRPRGSWTSGRRAAGTASSPRSLFFSERSAVRGASRRDDAEASRRLGHVERGDVGRRRRASSSTPRRRDGAKSSATCAAHESGARAGEAGEARLRRRPRRRARARASPGSVRGQTCGASARHAVHARARRARRCVRVPRARRGETRVDVGRRATLGGAGSVHAAAGSSRLESARGTPAISRRARESSRRRGKGASPRRRARRPRTPTAAASTAALAAARVARGSRRARRSLGACARDRSVHARTPRCHAVFRRAALAVERPTSTARRRRRRPPRAIAAPRPLRRTRRRCARRAAARRSSRAGAPRRLRGSRAARRARPGSSRGARLGAADRAERRGRSACLLIGFAVSADDPPPNAIERFHATESRWRESSDRRRPRRRSVGYAPLASRGRFCDAAGRRLFHGAAASAADPGPAPPRSFLRNPAVGAALEPTRVFAIAGETGTLQVASPAVRRRRAAGRGRPPERGKSARRGERKSTGVAGRTSPRHDRRWGGPRRSARPRGRTSPVDRTTTRRFNVVQGIVEGSFLGFSKNPTSASRRGARHSRRRTPAR